MVFQGVIMKLRFEFTNHEYFGMVTDGTILNNYTFKENHILVVETHLGIFELTPENIKILEMWS